MGIHTLGQLGSDKNSLGTWPKESACGKRANGRPIDCSNWFAHRVVPGEFEFEREIETPSVAFICAFFGHTAVVGSKLSRRKGTALRITFGNNKYTSAFSKFAAANEVDLLFRMLRRSGNFRSEHPIVAVALSASRSNLPGNNSII
jgi:hypothetical protein